MWLLLGAGGVGTSFSYDRAATTQMLSFSSPMVAFGFSNSSRGRLRALSRFLGEALDDQR